MALFGPSKKEIWKELSERINANYIEGSVLKKSRVEYSHKSWTIYLDTHTVSSGKSSTTYTRMRAPFINNNKFCFKINKKGLLSGIGKAFGMQNIESGYDSFDKDFIIKGNDELVVKDLLQDKNIRNLMQNQPKMNLQIKDSQGVLGPSFNENESELYFKVVGVIKDIDRLKSLFQLFIKILDNFELKGITLNHAPEVKLYKD
ncbi:hypothetical protein SH2C18_24140 [Clostridium sediminicola]|uniref:DUF3137 domain-containing protein n=1 Tax=Clostridium sediminicola TaxID=3114879 RepID=UPI0031F1F9C6